MVLPVVLSVDYDVVWKPIIRFRKSTFQCPCWASADFFAHEKDNYKPVGFSEGAKMPLNPPKDTFNGVLYISPSPPLLFETASPSPHAPSQKARKPDTIIKSRPFFNSRLKLRDGERKPLLREVSGCIRSVILHPKESYKS